jgi:hypothetical protein
MMHAAMKPKPIILLSFLLIASGATWALWPEPEPEPEPELEDIDTGLTRMQTEEMMRSIGYVQ